MIHTLILAVLLYAIVRAALRRSPPDPMAGRLVHRSASMSAVRPQPATVAAPTPRAPEPVLKPGHYLKAYWPKEYPMPEDWQ